MYRHSCLPMLSFVLNYSFSVYLLRFLSFHLYILFIISSLFPNDNPILYVVHILCTSIIFYTTPKIIFSFIAEVLLTNIYLPAYFCISSLFTPSFLPRILSFWIFPILNTLDFFPFLPQLLVLFIAFRLSYFILVHLSLRIPFSDLFLTQVPFLFFFFWW